MRLSFLVKTHYNEAKTSGIMFLENLVKCMLIIYKSDGI